MARLSVFLIILLLLAGCAAPATETTSPEAPPIPTLDDKQAPTAAPAEPTASEEASPTLEPTAAATVPPDSAVAGPGRLAYIARDGSLSTYDLETGDMEVLQAAEGYAPGTTPTGPTTIFHNPAWSSDGQLLAYTREAGTPVDVGYQFVYTLEVYDLASGQSRVLLEDEVMATTSWRPGTHQLAFSTTIPTEYFIDLNPELATPIMGVDADSGEVVELVQPERGFALFGPRWSSDGRYLGFQEVRAMEGAGDFAYYDFEAGEYIAWEQAIGSYDWSPDGERLAFDRQTYMPTGGERIFEADLQGENEMQRSPDMEGGYAFGPRYSPDGSQIAYWQAPLAEDEPRLYELSVVTPADEGIIQPLGQFEQAGWLSWSEDGQSLLFAAGPFGEQSVVMVDVASGEARTLVEGTAPAVQPTGPQG